jgi:hypothetical protein
MRTYAQSVDILRPPEEEAAGGRAARLPERVGRERLGQVAAARTAWSAFGLTAVIAAGSIVVGFVDDATLWMRKGATT